MRKTITSQCRYALLTSVLQREIEQGKYAIGAALPAETVLCKQFNVSRHTVREALRQLRQLGLVTSRQGSGTIVAANTVAPHYMQSLDSLDDFLEFLRLARAEILLKDISKLPINIAENYGVSNHNQLWLHIRLIRFWGEPCIPTLLSDMYIDGKYSGIKEIYDPNKPLSEMLEAMYGVTAHTLQQTIQAIALNKEQSKLLQSKPKSPALQTMRCCCSANGEPLVISCNISPAERYTYTTRMRVASAQ